MKKINFNLLFSFLIGAAFILDTYSVALAANDCTPPNSPVPNTCYSFNLGYKIEVLTAGYLDQVTGKQIWQYRLSKKTNANANMIYIGIEKEVKIDPTSDYSVYIEPCEGNPNENIGIGDCLRQYLGWSANFPTSSVTLTFYTNPVLLSTPTPVFVKAGDNTESGAIIAPAADTAQVLESTFDIQQSNNGSALAVKMDRYGNVLQAWGCEADCGNFPTNFTSLDLDLTSFDLGETYYCVPANDIFIANTSLTLDGETTAVHCGKMQFLEPKTTIQFEHTTICKNVSGVQRCFTF